MIIVAHGRLAYFGSTNDAIPYFASIGFPLPPMTNAAEHMLNIVNAEFDFKTDVDNILDEWDGDLGKDDTEIIEFDSNHTNLTLPYHSNPGFLSVQLPLLLKRSFIIAVRDPLVYWYRIAAFLVIGLFISVVYYKIDKYFLKNSTLIIVEIGWFFAVPSLLMISNVYQSYREFVIIDMETKANLYHPMAYIISHAIVEIPFIFILSLASIGIGGFGIAEFNPSEGPEMFLLFALMLYTFESFAQVCSVVW